MEYYFDNKARTRIPRHPHPARRHPMPRVELNNVVRRFGQVTAVRPMRSVQLQLRFRF